ncbi:MAG: hypothetical protein AAF411_14910 [Myxococcota bacterium]
MNGAASPEEHADGPAVEGQEYTPVEATPSAPTDRSNPSPETLLLQADNARRHGDLPRARALLLQIEGRFDGQPAAEAAFTLGRILAPFDPPGARAAFLRSIEHAPSGPLASEATRRLDQRSAERSP